MILWGIMTPTVGPNRQKEAHIHETGVVSLQRVGKAARRPAIVRVGRTHAQAVGRSAELNAPISSRGTGGRERAVFQGLDVVRTLARCRLPATGEDRLSREEAMKITGP